MEFMARRKGALLTWVGEGIKSEPGAAAASWSGREVEGNRCCPEVGKAMRGPWLAAQEGNTRADTPAGEGRPPAREVRRRAGMRVRFGGRKVVLTEAGTAIRAVPTRPSLGHSARPEERGTGQSGGVVRDRSYNDDSQTRCCERPGWTCRRRPFGTPVTRWGARSKPVKRPRHPSQDGSAQLAPRRQRLPAPPVYGSMDG